MYSIPGGLRPCLHWTLAMIMCEVRDSGIGHADRPWEPIPDSYEKGDILLSTQIVGVGKGLEGANEIDQMISDGFNIYGIAVATMDENGLLAAVSMWRRRSADEKGQARFRSTTGMKIG